MEEHKHPSAGILWKATRYLVAFFLIVSLNFLIPRLMPGDPLMNIIGEEAYYGSQDVLDSLRADLGLDKPFFAQYARYLIGVFTGDWGYSYLYMRPVFESVVLHLRWTFLLILPSVIIAACIGAVLGAVAAWRRGRRLDAVLTGSLLLAYSMPNYWLAMLALFIFSFLLGWFPLGGARSGDAVGLHYFIDIGWHMALPLAIITLSKTAYDFIIVRNSVVSVYGEDYVLMAQAKGLSQRAVLFRHALRNALTPLITVTAIQFGMIFSGALLVEVVFSLPGMGTLIYRAIEARDYPLLQFAFFIVAVCVLLANITADLLCLWLDPKTR